MIIENLHELINQYEARRNLSERVKINIVIREDKPKFCIDERSVLVDDMQKM